MVTGRGGMGSHKHGQDADQRSEAINQGVIQVMSYFVVPMQFKVTGLAFVEAETAEKARELADKAALVTEGEPDPVTFDYDAGEMLEWHSTGPAVPTGT